MHIRKKCTKKEETKKREAEEKLVKSADKDIDKRLRDNAQRKVPCALLRLSS